jgi:hypothetical protein
VGGQIIDDGIELIVRTISSFFDHIADDLLPSLFGVATSQDNFRSMTAAADFLECRLTGTIGQLGSAWFGKDCLADQKEDGQEASAMLSG